MVADPIIRLFDSIIRIIRYLTSHLPRAPREGRRHDTATLGGGGSRTATRERRQRLPRGTRSDIQGRTVCSPAQDRQPRKARQGRMRTPPSRRQRRTTLRCQGWPCERSSAAWARTGACGMHVPEPQPGTPQGETERTAVRNRSPARWRAESGCHCPEWSPPGGEWRGRRRLRWPRGTRDERWGRQRPPRSDVRRCATVISSEMPPPATSRRGPAPARRAG